MHAGLLGAKQEYSNSTLLTEELSTDPVNMILVISCVNSSMAVKWLGNPKGMTGARFK